MDIDLLDGPTTALVSGVPLDLAATATGLGREEAIPAMFTELVRALPGSSRVPSGALYDSRVLQTYLECHIDEDGGARGAVRLRPWSCAWGCAR